MKIYHLFIFFLLLSAFSCKNDDDYSVSEKIIIIDSKTEMLYDQVHAIERPYLRIKYQENSIEWSTIYGISGFDYEEGYLYRIKVREKVIKNPLPDQSKINYEFLELISKTKVTEPS